MEREEDRKRNHRSLSEIFILAILPDDDDDDDDDGLICLNFIRLRSRNSIDLDLLSFTINTKCHNSWFVQLILI